MAEALTKVSSLENLAVLPFHIPSSPYFDDLIGILIHLAKTGK